MSKGILVLNGTPPSDKIMENVLIAKKSQQKIYCTDGAYDYLINYCEPDVLIGDFDSIKAVENVSDCVEIFSFNAEKDFTDGFLAAKTMLARGFTDIEIYGAFGGRPDHEMSNYLILALCNECGVQAKFVGEQFDAFILSSARTISAGKGKTVSLVPFSDSVHILYTKGLKYPINNLVMSKVQNLNDEHYIMGVSNVCEADIIEYGLTQGLGLVYLEK